jgi:hypothetical protein
MIEQSKIQNQKWAGLFTIVLVVKETIPKISRVGLLWNRRI